MMALTEWVYKEEKDIGILCAWSLVSDCQERFGGASINDNAIKYHVLFQYLKNHIMLHKAAH